MSIYDTGAPPVIAESRCTGCGRCVAACRELLVTLEVAGYRKHAWRPFPGRCTRCLACAAACPVGAIVSPDRTSPV